MVTDDPQSAENCRRVLPQPMPLGQAVEYDKIESLSPDAKEVIGAARTSTASARRSSNHRAEHRSGILVPLDDVRTAGLKGNPQVPYVHTQRSRDDVRLRNNPGFGFVTRNNANHRADSCRVHRSDALCVRLRGVPFRVRVIKEQVQVSIFILKRLRHFGRIIHHPTPRKNGLNVRNLYVVESVAKDDRVQQAMQKRAKEALIRRTLGRQTTLEISHAGDSSKSRAHDLRTMSRESAASSPGSSSDG